MLQGDEQDVYTLIARKNYPKAIKILERDLKIDTDSVHLRQTLADLWARIGEPARAVEILAGLVDQLVADGFVSKAIAVLKKIQRIDPNCASAEMRLATLLQQQDGYFFEAPKPAGAAHRGSRSRSTAGRGCLLD